MKEFLNLLEEALTLRRDFRTKLDETPYDAGYFLHDEYERLKKIDAELLTKLRELTIPQGTVLDRSKRR